MGPLIWLGLAGLNAALGASKASQAAKQRKMEAEMRAAEIEASPWTGRSPSTQISTPQSNLWSEMAGAGINTLGQAAALQQAGLFTPSEGTSVSTTPYSLMYRQQNASPLMPTSPNRSFLNIWENQ